VPNNHQYHNAMELVKNGAAEIIEEKDLNAELLAAKINALLNDQEARNQMHLNALKLGRKDAADQMIAWIKELAK
jgi:UDP-N-acetylglucosamine--N-acetylmuramyl-(pentapeptide) pyrophosphoryl-undecaprenol N-acetylglucosamine transferase